MLDTIFALATAQGRSALAVIRVSGPQTNRILITLCNDPPVPRRASLRTLSNDEGEVLDKGLVVYFPAPQSYTGEDLVEFQVHGGLAVIEAVCAALVKLGGRLAEPGEFTRRAFEAGKLDLTQAEALADLIDAETASQRRQALAQLDGQQMRLADRWRSDLIEAAAYLEAQIDFADEEIPLDVAQRARSVLERLLAEITSAISEHRGQQIRNGLKVALIGLPNAGKSSLLNALAGRNAAIVDAEAGTTRDIIEVDLILRGYKVILADTAGVRETENSVEQEGVRRAISWADAADLRLLIKDGAADAPMESSLLGLGRKGDWIIISKCDEQTSRADQDVVHDPVDDRFVVMEASIYRPQTLLALRDRLSTWAVDALSGADFPAVTRERHRRLLIEVQAHLERGLKRQDLSVELVAEDVRLAARSIERLSGRIGSEDILDHVFGSFCIGK